MFHSYLLRLNRQIVLFTLFQLVLSPIESSQVRSRRDIGGESLDTSNFVLTIDANGSRFIEVPKEYMANWLDDQIMWRTWTIILAILCIVLFSALLFFVIYGCCTSTGPFVDCLRSVNESLSDGRLTASGMSLQIDETPKPTIRAPPYSVVPLKTTGPLYLK